MSESLLLWIIYARRLPDDHRALLCQILDVSNTVRVSGKETEDRTEIRKRCVCVP